jgi:mono/diheme cytochrome c family protein
MKHFTQVIAAGSLAVLLMLLQWSGGAAGSFMRTHRGSSGGGDGAAQGASGRAGDAPAPHDEQQQQRDARATFDAKCATCHGKDGRAKTLKAKFNKARNLTDAAWQAEASDERIYNSINNGRGKKMPAFARKLSRAEVEGLVGYVRGLKQ